MNLEKYKTAAGIRADRIRAALAEPFSDPKAYKKVNGTGADLTDINTGHMLQRLNDTFGMKGLGWNLIFQRDDIIVDGGGSRITVRLKYAEFVYYLQADDEDERIEVRIPTSGANQNTPQYAEEGAKTVALGTALKGLGFQEAVYTGHLNHRNASSYHSGNGHHGSKAATTGGNGHKKSRSRPVTKKAKPPKKKASKAKEYSPGDAGAYIVPFGTNKGTALSELSQDDLKWAAKDMSPFNEKGNEYQHKAQEYLRANTA
ncbi:MAG: hypothetical protein U9Q82_07195 [Chloroflexota bacterium]|nr:hypothetical protein [Chloroflexota bacterium]